MNRKRILYILIIILFSCQAQNKKIEFDEKNIQNKFKRTLREIGVKVKDSIFLQENTLNYIIIKDSGYYVDNNTNHLLRSYLLVKYYEDLKMLDSVNISEEYKNLTDKTTYHYPIEGINKIRERLSKNSLFIDLIPPLVRKTNANDIIYMDDTINELSKYLDEEEYNFKGHGFWEFIYEYTLNCCDPESDMHKNIEQVYYASTYPEFPTRPDIFKYVIEESEKYCQGKE